MNKRILVVAAHADDEALGCGGTMARHAAEGDEVYAVFVADGVTSRAGGGEAEELARTRAEKTASQILGVKETYHLGLPDNRLDSLSMLEVIQPLENLIQKLVPDTIYTHHYGDLNVDHRVVHQALMTACRPLPASSVREIFTFEVVSSSEWNSPVASPFVPQMHVDIFGYLDKKMAALDAYGLEMRAPPHSRSVDHVGALAMHRGHSVGICAAEAFMVMRMLR